MNELIKLAAQIYILVIIAAAIVTWVEVDRQHPLVQFLFKVTDPLFKWVRELIPPFNGLDLTPLIALLGVKLVEKVLVALLEF
jgi:YggT family protein